MKDQFRRLAYYNKWANGRIYAAAGALDREDYFADRRAFFKSVHGTLNHIMAIDKLWFGRFTGNLYAIPSLDVILHDNFDDLHAARIALDDHIIDVIEGMDGSVVYGRPTLDHHRRRTLYVDSRSRADPDFQPSDASSRAGAYAPVAIDRRCTADRLLPVHESRFQGGGP